MTRWCFVALYERNEHYVKSLQLSYHLSLADAEDLNADTYMRLYKHLHNHPYNIVGNLNGFMNRIARRLYLDDIGHNEQQHEDLEERHIDELECTLLTNPDEDRLLATDTVDELLRRIPAVKGGDERKQWLLRLLLLEDCTPREIAALDQVARELVRN